MVGTFIDFERDLLEEEHGFNKKGEQKRTFKPILFLFLFFFNNLTAPK